MNKLFKDNYNLMHTGKSNGFIYQTSHQDLLHLPNPLFYYVDYL